MGTENQKESLKLLELSGSGSDSGSDIPEFTLPRRKIKVKRKFRPGLNGKKTTKSCSSSLVLKLFAVIFLLICIGVATWLILNLYARIDQLSKRLQDVEAGTRGTPEEFHNIHMQLKDLEWNSSRMRDDIHKISGDVSLLSKDIEILKQTADSLQKSIVAAPQIESLPKDVLSLQQSLAEMGSTITNMETKIKKMKDQNANSVKQLQTDIENLKNEMQTISEPQTQMTTVTPSSVYSEEINKLNGQIDEINKTLSGKIKLGMVTMQEHQLAIAEFENVTTNLTNRIHVIEMKNGFGDISQEQIQHIVQEQLNITLLEMERKQWNISEDIAQLQKNSSGLSAVMSSLANLVQGLILAAHNDSSQTNSGIIGKQKPATPPQHSPTPLPHFKDQTLKQLPTQNISQLLGMNSSSPTEDSVSNISNTNDRKGKQLSNT